MSSHVAYEAFPFRGSARLVVEWTAFLLSVVLFSFASRAQSRQSAASGGFDPGETTQLIRDPVRALEIIAENSIFKPKKAPFPEKTAEYFKKFYHSRSNLFVMVGTNFLEYSEFRVNSGKLLIVQGSGLTGSWRINQHLGEGLYLVGNSSFVLEVGNPNLVEDEWVRGVALGYEIYNYTTVLGANRQIPKRMLVKPRPATWEEFGDAVKAGYKFKSTYNENVICPDCKGAKIVPTIATTSRGKVRPMSDRCETCLGVGHLKAMHAALLSWKHGP